MKGFFVRPAALAVLLAWPLIDCSGQTGSVSVDVPGYESSSDFDPDEGGGSLDGGGGSCSRPTASNVGDEVVAEYEGLVVLAVSPLQLPPKYGVPQLSVERGLVLLDVSAPDAPTVVGELALEGYPWALVVEGGVASVVVSRPATFDGDEIPEQRIPLQQNYLVRVDLGEPEAPRALDEHPLPANVESTQAVGNCVFVLSEPDDLEPACQDGSVENGLDEGNGETCPPTEKKLEAYSTQGENVELSDSLSFEGVYGAFGGRGFYAMATGSYDAEQDLVVAKLDGENCELTTLAPVTVDAPIHAVGYDGVDVTVASSDGVAIFDVSDEPEALGVVSAPGVIALDPLDGTGWLAESGISPWSTEPSDAMDDEVLVIDTSDPASVQAAKLPATREAATLGEFVIGVGDNGSGAAVFTLYDVSEAGSPLAVDRVEPGFGYQNSSGSHRWSSNDATGRVYYPYWANSSMRLGVVDVASGVFESFASHELPADGYGRLSSAGDVAVVTGEGWVATASGTGASDAGTLQLFEDEPEVVLDEVRAGGYDVRLMRGGDAVWVEFSKADDEGNERFELEHFATELAKSGDYVLALGMRRYADCDIEDFPEGEWICPTPNQAGISIFSLVDRPELAKTVLLPTDFDAPELPADASYEVYWPGYATLDGGNLLLPARSIVRCETQAACDELGIVAYEGFGTPGCSSDCENVDPEPFVSYSGSESRELLYVLDLQGNTPRLSDGVELGGEVYFVDEGPLDLGAAVLDGGSVMGLTREEPIYDANGEGVSDENGQALYRFFVELLKIEPDGTPRFVDSVNTPGLPIALGEGGGEVFTVEPRWVSQKRIDALLHRSEIRDGGAYITETLNLGENFRQARAAWGQLVVLSGSRGCDPDPVTDVSLLDPSKQLDASLDLELDGNDWSFATFDWPWPRDTVTLSGGPLSSRGRLVLGVEGGEISVERYFSP